MLSCCIFCSSPAAKRKLQAVDGINQSSCSLSKELDAFFILREILEIPQQNFARYLVENGNPSDWEVFSCSDCSSKFVQSSRDTFHEIRKLQKRLKNLKGKAVEQIKSSFKKTASPVKEYRKRNRPIEFSPVSTQVRSWVLENKGWSLSSKEAKVCEVEILSVSMSSEKGEKETQTDEDLSMALSDSRAQSLERQLLADLEKSNSFQRNSEPFERSASSGSDSSCIIILDESDGALTEDEKQMDRASKFSEDQVESNEEFLSSKAFTLPMFSPSINNCKLSAEKMADGVFTEDKKQTDTVSKFSDYQVEVQPSLGFFSPETSTLPCPASAINNRSLSVEKMAAAEAAFQRYEKSQQKANGKKLNGKKDSLAKVVELEESSMKNNVVDEPKSQEVNLSQAGNLLLSQRSRPSHENSNNELYKFPLTGPQLLTKIQAEAKIRAYLFEQLDQYKNQLFDISCLLIHSCNEPQERVKKCIETLNQYIDNIIVHPHETKYREIRCRNAIFKDRVSSIVGADYFLKAAGFKKTWMPYGSTKQPFWIFCPDEESLQESINSLVELRGTLETTQAIRPEKVSSIPIASQSQNISGSELLKSVFNISDINTY